MKVYQYHSYCSLYLKSVASIGLGVVLRPTLIFIARKRIRFSRPLESLPSLLRHRDGWKRTSRVHPRSPKLQCHHLDWCRFHSTLSACSVSTNLRHRKLNPRQYLLWVCSSSNSLGRLGCFQCRIFYAPKPVVWRKERPNQFQLGHCKSCHRTTPQIPSSHWVCIRCWFWNHLGLVSWNVFHTHQCSYYFDCSQLADYNSLLNGTEAALLLV